MNDAVKHAPGPYLGCVLPFWPLWLKALVASGGFWGSLGASEASRGLWGGLLGTLGASGWEPLGGSL